MKSLNRPLRIVFVLLSSVLAVAFVCILNLRATVREQRDLAFSLANIDCMARAFQNMEIANTSFLVSGDLAYRDPFKGQVGVLSANYRELSESITIDRAQRDHLRMFKAKLSQWFKLYKPIIDHRRTEPDYPWIQRELSGIDQRGLLRCRLLCEEMLALLNEIRAAQEQKMGLAGVS